MKQLPFETLRNPEDGFENILGNKLVKRAMPLLQ